MPPAVAIYSITAAGHPPCAEHAPLMGWAVNIAQNAGLSKPASSENGAAQPDTLIRTRMVEPIVAGKGIIDTTLNGAGSMPCAKRLILIIAILLLVACRTQTLTPGCASATRADPGTERPSSFARAFWSLPLCLL